MKKWQIVLLTVTFCSLVGIYLFLQRPQKTDLSDLYVEVVPSLDKDQVTGIQVTLMDGSKTNSRLELSRQKGRWYVRLKRDGSEFWGPAKETRIERLLHELSGLQGEIRATGKANLAAFDLEKGHGLRIVVEGKGGRHLVDLVVGKKGPSWGSVFVRQADSDKVFLVSRDLLADFDIWSKEVKGPLGIKPWIDLDLVKVSGSGIEVCSYSSRGLKWRLEKKIQEKGSGSATDVSTDKNKTSGKGQIHGGHKWVVTINGLKSEPSRDDVMAFLSKIFPLHAREIGAPDKLERYGLGKKGLPVLFVKEDSGQEKRFTFGPCDKKEGLCWIKDERGFPFKVDMKVVEAVKNPLKRQDKVKEEATSTGPSATKNVKKARKSK